MTGETTFRLNRGVFARIVKSPEVVADVRARAERIADACGGTAAGYVARSSTPRRRARAAVITATGNAMRDNAKRNTILRNLGAGR